MPNVWLGIIDLKRVKQKINSSSMALKNGRIGVCQKTKKKEVVLKLEPFFIDEK